jgi:hypothetical protein
MALGNSAHAKNWHVPKHFATIQDAINSPDVTDGDTILVNPGNHAGALVNKSVEIMGKGRVIINDGPAHGSGLIQGFQLEVDSDGATISRLEFTVDLAIYNGAAVDEVTVEHCTFKDTIQAISNWGGSGWEISHNVITDLRTRNGGGIGILVADRTGGIVEKNVVSHNTISGTLHVWANDGGEYDGSGIVLYADFRGTREGAEEIKNNRVVQNHVSLVSDTPSVVDVWAFELTDTRDDTNADPYPVLLNNAIGFNDFRKTEKQIALTPLDLENHNDISRNLGDNRGQGLHPSAFGPGGN